MQNTSPGESMPDVSQASPTMFHRAKFLGSDSELSLRIDSEALVGVRSLEQVDGVHSHAVEQSVTGAIC